MDARTVVLVGVGGFAGAGSRHAIAISLPAAFPWGTLAVNVAGAFLLGLFVAESGGRSRAVRLAVSAGFLSSFTTYSTFAAETAALPPVLAAVNVAATYLLGVAAVVAAMGVSSWRS